jgi:hypothetical protein
MKRVKFKIEIDTANDAVQGEPVIEVARMLRTTYLRILGDEAGGPVRDVNGNTVGAWAFTIEEE